MTAAAVEPAEKVEIPFNKQPRDWRKAGIIVAFCAVPVALLVIFTYWPFGSMIGYSFYKMKYIGPREFVGLKNYIDVFTRPDTLSSLKLSLYYMAGALIQVGLALYLSSMLAFKVRGGSAFKAIYFFPYLINGIAVGFIFKFFYTRGYVFDTVLQWCGFQLDSLPYWLKDQSVNNWSLVGASIWRYLGQNVILFIGAMMSIDGSLYEAAEIDGANKFQQFRHIILPGIKTILVLNVILSITGSLSASSPYVITTGANGTATYFVRMDRIAHTSQKVGLASAMAIVLLIIILICALLQQLFFNYAFKDADDGVEKAKKKAAKIERQRARMAKKNAPIFKNGPSKTEKGGGMMTDAVALAKERSAAKTSGFWYKFKIGFFVFVKYLSLVFVAFMMLLPLVSCFVTAAKTDKEYHSTSVMDMPKNWLNFDNYVQAFTTSNMAVAFRNSIIVVVVVLIVTTIIGTMLAYALSRFRFPGNTFIRGMFTIAALLPGIAMQVALYKMMVNFHAVNTMWGYILMQCGTDVISIYVFIQFFENIPVSMDEAAIMDGASYFTVYYKILLPLLKPAIVTCAILKGVGVYNEYYAANLYLQNADLKTIAIALYSFTGPMGSKYNLICAGVIITLLPMLILFLIFQKQIYSGIAAGAVKE